MLSENQQGSDHISVFCLVSNSPHIFKVPQHLLWLSSSTSSETFISDKSMASLLFGLVANPLSTKKQTSQ